MGRGRWRGQDGGGAWTWDEAFFGGLGKGGNGHSERAAGGLWILFFLGAWVLFHSVFRYFWVFRVVAMLLPGNVFAARENWAAGGGGGAVTSFVFFAFCWL